MTKKTLPVLLLVITMLASGCSGKNNNRVLNDNTNFSESELPVISSAENSTSGSFDLSSGVPADASNIFTDRDFEVGYDESESTFIQLNGDTAACTSNAVQISGSTVTIIDEGTYILSGTLDDGMIIVNSGKTDKTQIVLNGVTIHSETSAPLYILQSDKVFITMAAGTTNTLSSGDAYTAIDANNIDAVIFSKEDITLNGSGSLVITSPAGHGIVSKDSLTITSGSYDINCASHALAGKDNVCIANGDFTIVSGKDGIHAENTDDITAGFVYILNGTYNIVSEGDGISAAAYMYIENGAFDIMSGGGSANASFRASEPRRNNFMGGGRQPGEKTDSTSGKGIKAAADLNINGGIFTVNSADDSVHSNASLTISGGTFEIASGDDAFHADKSLKIVDGTINISESYEGLEALHIEISGGSITIAASDDGINAAGGTDSSGTAGGRDGMFGHGMSSSNGSITISGGTIGVTAYGDGIDANGSLDITGGYITVCGPTQGDTSTLDYDTSATITGGTFMGSGAAGMAQSFSGSGQGVITANIGNQSAGTEIRLTDSEGNTVLTYTPDLSFSVVILSSPDMITGETYTLTAGSVSKEYTAS